jgi:hypothetical protein
VRVLHPVEVREGDKFIGIYPGSGYNIRYNIDFPAPIGQQSASVDLAAETYGTEIAPARTFGYKADEQRLRDMGLIRGARRGNCPWTPAWRYPFQPGPDWRIGLRFQPGSYPFSDSKAPAPAPCWGAAPRTPLSDPKVSLTVY